MSKSPAKKAPASRSKGAAGKASAKAAPKHSPAKKAAKPSPKAKVAPAKAAAKPASKPAKKAARPAPPAKKTPVKPVAKPAPKAGTKLAPKAAAAKPAGKPTARPSSHVPAPASATPVPSTVSPPLPKSQDKPQSKPAPTLPPAATAAPNRFAERFSPPRPPQRVLPEPIEPVRPVIKADPRLANAWKSKAGRDLTEAELLAMPDAEYMNEKQLEFFRGRLQALKDDLLSNAGETTEHLREDTSIVPDPADRATIEEEHALELRTRDRERKLLKKISQSLSRIEAGDYGYCDETGEPIGLGRLLARPTATLSLEAQRRRELKQKMFGD
ncbi:MAG: RNA polymerase-binding protein DksA [Burkholderiaceae bacterium]